MKLAPAARLSALCLAAALGCGCRDSGAPSSEPRAPERSEEQGSSEPSDESSLEPLAQKSVLVYFPSGSSTGLVGQRREIVRTATPGDQAKQILSELLSGPDEGSAGVAAVPLGTRLIQVYVLQNGTAYADFSAELRSAIDGGSDAELLTVYSIVDSIALNVPQIYRVGILVEGQPCETLNGHLDLRRPLPPDRELLNDPVAEPPAESDV